MLLALGFSAPAMAGDVAVRGETVLTAAGAPIGDGVVIVRNGRIESVGPASQVKVPEGMRVLPAKVVTPASWTRTPWWACRVT